MHNMKGNQNGRRSTAKEIAFCAVMTALLIGGQAAFFPISGIEIVTVLLLTFSWSFGPRAGAMVATAFSLLRCLIWGFHPPVIALYLLYYPAFALLFGMLGKNASRRSAVAVFVTTNILLIFIAVACVLCAATDFLKLSILDIQSIRILLWVCFACCCGLLLLLNGSRILSCLRMRSESLTRTISVTAIAALCTICFTLLDDVITPIYYGLEWGGSTFITYFYASFLALVPQTLCTIVTVGALFLPLTKAFATIRS